LCNRTLEVGAIHRPKCRHRNSRNGNQKLSKAIRLSGRKQPVQQAVLEKHHHTWLLSRSPLMRRWKLSASGNNFLAVLSFLYLGFQKNGRGCGDNRKATQDFYRSRRWPTDQFRRASGVGVQGLTEGWSGISCPLPAIHRQVKDLSVEGSCNVGCNRWGLKPNAACLLGIARFLAGRNLIGDSRCSVLRLCSAHCR
jgi:hypothetical protein